MAVTKFRRAATDRRGAVIVVCIAIENAAKDAGHERDRYVIGVCICCCDRIGVGVGLSISIKSVVVLRAL
jgi:hypothetical protein